jgi:hypothetical protein
VSGPAPRLILPSEYEDTSGLVRLPTFQFDRQQHMPQLQANEHAALRGVLGEPPVYAIASPPSFHDQIFPFATHQELFQKLTDGDTAALVEMPDPSVADVIEMVRGVPFQPAMMYLAALQKAVHTRGIDPVAQRQLMRVVYGERSPIAAAGEIWLREHRGRAAIIFEQQLFALQRLVMLHATDRAADLLTADETLSLRLALLYVPSNIGSGSSSETAGSRHTVRSCSTSRGHTACTA